MLLWTSFLFFSFFSSCLLLFLFFSDCLLAVARNTIDFLMPCYMLWCFKNQHILIFLPLIVEICVPTLESGSGSSQPKKYSRSSAGPVSRSLETSSFHFLPLGILASWAQPPCCEEAQAAHGESTWKSRTEAFSTQQHQLTSHRREPSWLLQPPWELLLLVRPGQRWAFPARPCLRCRFVSKINDHCWFEPLNFWGGLFHRTR